MKTVGKIEIKELFTLLRSKQKPLPVAPLSIVESKQVPKGTLFLIHGSSCYSQFIGI